MAECSIAFPWSLDTQRSRVCHKIGSKPVFDEAELFKSVRACAAAPLSLTTDMLNDLAITFPC